MEHVKQGRLRFFALTGGFLLAAAGLGIAARLFTGSGAAALAQTPQPHLALQGTHSGRATLREVDRVTFLDFAPASGASISLPLTHPGKRPQWTDGPFRSHLIAEVPGKFLIFTDSMRSNPTNIQGECGASPSGERFLHVVSLAPPAHETLSTLIESCIDDFTPRPLIPVFDPTQSTLTVRYAPGSDGVGKVYHIESDGSVKVK